MGSTILTMKYLLLPLLVCFVVTLTTGQRGRRQRGSKPPRGLVPNISEASNGCQGGPKFSPGRGKRHTSSVPVYVWGPGWQWYGHSECPWAHGVFSSSSVRWCYEKSSAGCQWMWTPSTSWKCVRKCCCDGAWSVIIKSSGAASC